ncbi:fucolectin-6-like [Conger conger]|nr:fucolectin-6-like [Conger conger]
MKVKMMILLFQILSILTLNSCSAQIPPYPYVEENVALRGKASQSDLHLGEWTAYSHASNAIDGNRNSNMSLGSCTHTTNKPNPWWRVDLLQTYLIASVTITNRGDCCGERINKARILIGSSIHAAQCSMIDGLSTGETKTFHCPQPMIGRYVTVILRKKEYLHICEVEVNALLPAPS